MTSARVPGGKLARAHHFDHALVQREQAQKVGHGGTALAQPLGGALLRVAALLHQVFHAQRFFNGVEIFALQVFNQRRFQPHGLVPIAHDGRHFL